MENIQRRRMAKRVSLVAVIFFTLFWGIWYLSAGEVPTLTEIRWSSEDTIIQLPFSISRFWDIVFAPIWVFSLIYLLTCKGVKNENILVNLLFGLIIGLIAGLALILAINLGHFNLVDVLIFGLIIGAGMGIFISIGLSLKSSLHVGLVICLSFGLGLSFIFGLVFGLIVGLGLNLIVSFLIFIFYKENLIIFGRWLIGK